MKWIGELDIIMQRDSANLLYKKVQDKRGEQVHFVYDFKSYIQDWTQLWKLRNLR